jgi:CheY-like chemotaxis protein
MRSKQSVFIVDDDPDDRESIRDAFVANKHNNYDFVFMHNGEQLLQHLNAKKQDHLSSLILLDLNMPGKNGQDVLKEIKSNSLLQPIPVVVLTTSSSEKDRETSYELGANCFVTKPDSYKGLMEVTDSIARLWMEQ